MRKKMSQDFKIGDTTFSFPKLDDPNSELYLTNAFELYKILKNKTITTEEDLKYFENKNFNDTTLNNKQKYENF